MLVSDYLNIVYEEIDKEGMPYFEESDLIKRFEIATYAFLEQNKPYIQFNQKAKEDLGNLTFNFSQSTHAQGLFELPSDYYGIVSLRCDFGNGNQGLKIIQSNEVEAMTADPFNSPIEDDPFAEFYNNRLKVYPIPNNINGLYLKHPTFGSDDLDELCEQLPIHIQYFIITKVVGNLMKRIEDSRFQMHYYEQMQNA